MASSTLSLGSNDSPCYTSDQIDTVWSWVHDERRCVLAKSISLELSIPRSVAHALLEDLPTHRIHHDGQSHRTTYEITRLCCVKEKRGKGSTKKTVVKLIKSSVTVPPHSIQNQDPTSNNNNGQIYSIALLDKNVGFAPSVHSAYEHAMATLRDLVLDHGAASAAALDPALHCNIIRPAPQYATEEGLVRRIDARTRRNLRVSGNNHDNHNKQPLPPSTSSLSVTGHKAHVTAAFKKKNVTTAAAFFGSKSTKKSIEDGEGSNKGPPNKKDTKEESSSELSNNKFNTIKNDSKSGNKSVNASNRNHNNNNNKSDGGDDTTEEAIEKTNSETKSKVETSRKGPDAKTSGENDEKDKEKKENSLDSPKKHTRSRGGGSGSGSGSGGGMGKTTNQKNKMNKVSNTLPSTRDSDAKIGTADDFVGDEDEDEEFLQEEEERKRRNAIEARRQVREDANNERAKMRNKSKLSKHRRVPPSVADEDGASGTEVDDMMDVDDEERLEQNSGKKSKKKVMDDDAPTVVGAMDAFMNHGNDNGGSTKGDALVNGTERKKKRRKKLVEKTFRGENGFLVTETVPVWEDVPSDEEAASGRTGSSNQNLSKQQKFAGSNKRDGMHKGPKNVAKKKQMGLGSFFSKK